jgi:DNA-3-methyladenine glycosylase I
VATENARRIRSLRGELGSFKGWLDSRDPQPLENRVKLCERTFVFTGRQIVNEFLMSSGQLTGARTPAPGL